MNILDLAPTIAHIIDRFVPDPNKAAEMKLEMAKVEASENVAKMETQKAWLANHNWFVSGAIPAILRTADSATDDGGSMRTLRSTARMRATSSRGTKGLVR